MDISRRNNIENSHFIYCRKSGRIYRGQKWGSGMAPGTDTECPESSFYRKDPVYFGAALLTGKKTSERGRERHLTLRRSRSCAAADKRGSAYFRDSLPARRRNPSVRGA